jgi:hypothetical protein
MNQQLSTIPAAALAKLRVKAALEQSIEVWRPQPVDTLEGVIVGSRKVEGPFGEQLQCLVQTPEGAVIAVWLTQWLLGQLRAQAADIGDLVSLSFLGKEVGKRGMSLVVVKVDDGSDC